jgi:hypothetical protein
MEWETAGALDNGVPNALYLPGWSAGSGGCYTGSPCWSVNTPAEIKRSFNRGDTWEVISDFLNLLGTGRKGVFRIFSSPHDPNDLLVHFPSGQRVFRTRMARGHAAIVRHSWQEVYVPRTDRFIADIDFDPKDPDVLYFAYSSEVMDDDVAAGSGMVFKVRYEDPSNPMNAISTDLSMVGGPLNALPNTGIGSEELVLGRGSNGGIYVATDLGVYYTNSEFLGNGTGWQLLGGNLPHRSCAGLEISYKANEIRAGMSGRGVWEHDLWCPSEPDWNESGTYLADAFKEAIESVTSTAVVPSDLDVSYRAGSHVRLLPGFHAEGGSDFHAFIHPCDRSGNSFKVLPIHATPPVAEGTGPAIQGHSALRVQPNPNQGQFSVKLNEELPDFKAIRLMNAQGAAVPFSLRQTPTSLEVTLSGSIPAGVYVLKVSLPSGAVHYAKIIVQP